MDTFANQLDKIIREKKIPIKYPRGYQVWKKKFDQAYQETQDVNKALDKIHGKVGTFTPCAASNQIKKPNSTTSQP